MGPAQVTAFAFRFPSIASIETACCQLSKLLPAEGHTSARMSEGWQWSGLALPTACH